VNRLSPFEESAQGGSLLALGVDAERTRGCLLEYIRGSYRLAAWHSTPRQGERHLADPVAVFCRELGSRLGRRLWDEDAGAPLLESSDPLRYPPLAQMTLALNARSPLRIWIAGLTAGHSVEALRVAAASSATTVVGATYLTVSCTAENVGQALAAGRVDVVILAGGYDVVGAASYQPMHFLATVIAGALARLPRRSRPLVLYAGSRFAAETVRATLQEIEAAVQVTPNVSPSPGVIRQDALVRALDAHYWRLCERSDGYALVARWHTSPAAMTTAETNFVRLVQMWMALHNLTDLHGVYCGAGTPAARLRLHVWAGEEGPAVAVRALDAEAPLPVEWPAPMLVSGVWPDRASLPPGVRWWDRSGLAPIVATLGPVVPAAVQQTLTHDLFVRGP
jgi:hypothetical protein